MFLKIALLSGAALCLPCAADAQSTQTCPTGAANCTISVQDAGHNSTAASADNSQSTSSIAGTSSASNQSGNSVAPVFDNSPQTTQNANTTTGSISSGSTSTGNMSTNNNQSSASNGQSNTGTSSASNGQSNTGSSTNTLGGSSSGGNTLATGASTSSASLSGGNSTTTVDASDRSSTQYKAIFIPSVIPGTPPSQLAVGNIIKETSACGPMQTIVRQPVNGTFIGLLRNSAVPQGWTDDLEPYRDANGTPMEYRQVRTANGDVRVFGQQVIMFTTVIGVASNRNLALGGGGGGGSWGQAGMGSSSSNQRMVTTIQLRDCEIGTLRMTRVEVAPKTIRQ